MSAADASMEDFDNEFDHIDESQLRWLGGFHEAQEEEVDILQVRWFVQEEKLLQAEFGASTHTLKFFQC